MFYNDTDVGTLRNRLYSRDSSFNNFKGLTKEDIETLKEKVNYVSKNFEYRGLYQKTGLTNYINTLRYLTNPTIHTELKTYDEKILFLILSCDPDLDIMKTFIGSSITPKSRIADEEDEKKRKELQAKRDIELASFEGDVRAKIGFYDPAFLRYEGILHRGLLKKEGFINDVKAPSVEVILHRSELVKNLNIISEETLERLVSIKESWLKEAKDPSDLNSLAYNLLNRYRDLHIYNVEEQVLVFMLIADPDLDLLRMYEEESNFKKLEERAKKELGFYNKGLINVEQFYHDKFEPERKLSAWTK